MKKSQTISEENGILSGFNPNADFVTEDMALEYLAELLVDIYLDEKEYESRNKKSKTKSSDLLPGINQATS